MPPADGGDLPEPDKPLCCSSPLAWLFPCSRDLGVAPAVDALAADGGDLPGHSEECMEPRMDAALGVPSDSGADVWCVPLRAPARSTPAWAPTQGWQGQRAAVAVAAAVRARLSRLHSPCSRVMPSALPLADPAPDSPLNCDAGNLLRAGDTRGYNSMARMFTIENAMNSRR